MPRRELLTSLEREQLFALPRDDGALLRIAALSREDLAFIGQHRGDHNRLGVGIQLCYLRYPGRVLGSDEVPNAQLLGFVAASSEFLLMFGTFMPNATRRGASIYKRS
jgi:TnpA family transposase